MTEKETTISNISENLTRMTNSFTENKNTPQFIGIFALGILIVLIVFIIMYVVKGRTVSYMNSVKVNDSIISLNYPAIQYDSCGNIIVIDSSGNLTGNDGTYYINDYFIYGSNWAYEKYRIFYKIPENKSIVIKNAIHSLCYR